MNERACAAGLKTAGNTIKGILKKEEDLRRVDSKIELDR